MGRTLNIAIITLVIAWILGMIFSAVFGFLIHLLLLLAFIAVILRIYVWVKPKRGTMRPKDEGRSSPA